MQNFGVSHSGTRLFIKTVGVSSPKVFTFKLDFFQTGILCWNILFYSWRKRPKGFDTQGIFRQSVCSKGQNCIWDKCCNHKKSGRA